MPGNNLNERNRRNSAHPTANSPYTIQLNVEIYMCGPSIRGSDILRETGIAINNMKYSGFKY